MKLTLTIGLPRSGKSTWARKQGVPVVSSDAIRLALFGKLWWPSGEHEVMPLARSMVRALFLAGHDHIIFDSLSLTKESRLFWIPNSDCLWEIEHKIIDTSKEECCMRAITEGQPYLLPIIEKCAKVRDLSPPMTNQTKDDWNEWDVIDNKPPTK